MRFIFAYFVVFGHVFTKYLFGEYQDLYKVITINQTGYIAVDFFFIIAGFFLIYTFKKQTSFLDFMKYKIARLWPLMFFVFVLGVFGNIFHCFKFNMYTSILSLFLLEGVGITLTRNILGFSWFISVLFFVSGFYFYIFKNVKKTTCNLAIALIVLFGYTFLIHATHGSLSDRFTTHFYFLNTGLFRGICGMGMGYLLHELYQHIIQYPYKSSFKSAILYTIIECYLLGFIVYESVLHKMSFSNKFILVLAFCILFMLFLIKRGFLSVILNNKYSAELGKYAFSIYMMHVLLAYFMKKFYTIYFMEFLHTHPYVNVIIIISIITIISILVYHLVEVPAGKYLKKKFFPKNV